MPKNMAKIIVSDFSENEKQMLAELIHIIVKEIVREVCND